MHGGKGFRHLFRAAIGTLLLSGAVIAPAQPATATVTVGLSLINWAYTDSRNPESSYVDQGVRHPVGAWRDAEGKHHKSRAYFTFDLSAVRGTEIVSAVMAFEEKEANDCDKPRTWQLWRTTGITPATSWDSAPQELELLGSPQGFGCPAEWVGIDLRDTVVAALARGDRSLTVGLRVPEDSEGNLHLGRRISWFPTASVTANTEPFVPADLAIDNRPCMPATPMWVNLLSPELRARVDDPDRGGAQSQPVNATFAVWAVDSPSERLESTSRTSPAPSTFRYRIPDGFLQPDRLYAWSVRANDDRTSSAWAPECRFTVDLTGPATGPTVTSIDYPPGGPGNGGVGIPGDFTFSANGDKDVVGFRYFLSTGPTGYVAADAPGGSATVSLIPLWPGEHELYVMSVDAASNASEPTVYTFHARDTMPYAQDTEPKNWAGDPRIVIFHPGMKNVTSYLYRIDEGPIQTIAAGPDGTAQVSVVPSPWGSVLYLSSVSADGIVVGESYNLLAVDTTPFVTSPDFIDATGTVGVTGTFTLAPHMHAVAGYDVILLDPNGSAARQTVAAGKDGVATLPFTPAIAGYHWLYVLSRTADGFESPYQMVSFLVLDPT